jgi:4-hydroxy-tetrahydrodipicolinate reductase
MKLAIAGYGKMGKLIEQLAPEYGFEVALKLDEFNNADYSGITPENFAGVKVAIEFSTPETAIHNIERISNLGVHLVVGTTGWLAHLDRARAAVARNGTGLVWAPNFSIGVNLFSRIVAEAARLFASEPDYDAWAWEIHHSTKKDAPSGTLLNLVQTMEKAGYGRPINISSNRAGRHPGTHEIGFDSAADTITLRHTSRNREGLARGALKAAQWIAGRQGFYEFSDVLFGAGPA